MVVSSPMRVKPKAARRRHLQAARSEAEAGFADSRCSAAIPVAGRHPRAGFQSIWDLPEPRKVRKVLLDQLLRGRKRGFVVGKISGGRSDENQRHYRHTNPPHWRHV